MTNAAAIVLAAIIALALGLDAALNDWQGTLFAARKGLDLLAYLAFWR